LSLKEYDLLICWTPWPVFQDGWNKKILIKSNQTKKVWFKCRPPFFSFFFYKTNQKNHVLFFVKPSDDLFYFEKLNYWIPCFKKKKHLFNICFSQLFLFRSLLTISNTFSLPFQGSFLLSFTLLFRYRSPQSWYWVLWRTYVTL